MKIKSLIRLFIAVVLLSILFIPSVLATWIYAENPIQDEIAGINVSLLDFPFKPEEILPGHEVGDLDLNHQEVVNNVTNLRQYGLNEDNKKSLKNYLVTYGGVVYSNQPGITCGNLKFVGDESELLMWIVVKESETECSIYTFSKETINRYNEGDAVVVYKTKCLYENGEWNNVRSYTGESYVTEISGFYSISIARWHAT
ncbi:MAG: hypothetical protein J6Q58_03940 [Clostridia bacterium]|nr:hypothetical protein [Clostridia bacterium]